MNNELKNGDMVRTKFGDIEEVMSVEGIVVTTYESKRDLTWYHIGNVTKIS